MRILVTGAAGLLGTDIVFELEKQNHSCIRTRLSDGEGFVAADITTEEGTEKLAALEWDGIIHTAAWRDPDTCEKDQAFAEKINVAATRRLAEAASSKGAWILYISTDYVFNGKNPPYSEDDAPCPVNCYGRTKLAGEKATISACRESAVLRIPFLYGWRAGLEKSALLTSTLKALDSKSEVEMDDTVVRYPTYTADVAKAAAFLASRRAKGIFHCSSDTKTTRYGITLAMADLLGRNAAHIRRGTSVPKTMAERPADAHISSEKLLGLGCVKPKDFRTGLAECLLNLGMISERA